MVFRAVEGPVRLELEMPGAVFDEGSRIEATIVVTATRDASVLGARSNSRGIGPTTIAREPMSGGPMPPRPDAARTSAIELF